MARNPSSAIPTDLEGCRFGRLKAIAFVRRRSYQQLWRCLCDCGKECIVVRGNLKRNGSCGCAHGKHRLTGTPEYQSWQSMRQRCLNPNSKPYQNYGGRGIRICERWESFEAVLSDVGLRPTPAHTLERKNNEGNYEPDNVCWATRAQQLRNTRRNIFLTHNGETLCLKDWAIKLGCHPTTLLYRLKTVAADQVLAIPIGNVGRRRSKQK